MPSERAGKTSGVCSHCLSTRQLHLGDGTVHLHGPRNSPCPGSKLPPLTASQKTDKPSPRTAGPSVPSASAVIDDDQRVIDAAVIDGRVLQHQDLVGRPELFTHPDHGGPILKHIARGARLVCAQALSGILRSICSNPGSLDNSKALLQFAPCVLVQPSRTGRKRNMANIIKGRVQTWSQGQVPDQVTSGAGRSRPSHNSEALIAAINSKLEDGNVRAAVRILCDQSHPAPQNEENLEILLEKHPVDPDPDELLHLPDPKATTPLQITESDVMEAIRSFPSGSAGGPDGFRPGHLLDLLNHRESSTELLSVLTDFVNLLLRGGCPLEVRSILFGGNLIALSKKAGGLRPIAIGYVWRRIAAKCANKFAVGKLTSFFAPLQVGIATPAGCEAAAHAARRFITELPDDHVFVKLDFANAFNSLRRDVMLKAVLEAIPEIYRFVHQAYGTASLLRFGQFSISSQMGPQQGDPLCPLLFCLPLQPILRSLQSTFRLGYLDDLSLGGPEETVARDVELIHDRGGAMGLHLNAGKCEWYSHSGGLGDDHRMSDFQRLDRDSMILLGAPIFKGQALDDALEQQCGLLSEAIKNLQHLFSQSALILLRSSFGAPRISHLLRCSSCSDHSTLERLDNIMRDGLESIVNIKLDNTQWLQATLPIRHGGLGVRRVGSLASSAYTASAATTLALQSAILDLSSGVSDSHLGDILEARRETLPSCVDPLPAKQATWDKPVIEADKSAVWSNSNNPSDRARLLAASSPHSGDWLTALPIPS